MGHNLQVTTENVAAGVPDVKMNSPNPVHRTAVEAEAERNGNEKNYIQSPTNFYFMFRSVMWALPYV